MLPMMTYREPKESRTKPWKTIFMIMRKEENDSTERLRTSGQRSRRKTWGQKPLEKWSTRTNAEERLNNVRTEICNSQFIVKSVISTTKCKTDS